MDRSPHKRDMEKVHIAPTAILDFAFDDPLDIVPNLELSGYNYFDRFIAHDAIFPAAGSDTPTSYWPRTQAKMSGATMVASDSMMNFGVAAESLPHVIFSFGTAPE